MIPKWGEEMEKSHLNGIICDTLSTKKKSPIDIQIFNYKQCFDSFWLQEYLSDLFTSGGKDDSISASADGGPPSRVCAR